MALCQKIVTLVALCGLALFQTGFAQTGLTTIQDTLFKADGARFNGTLTIQWSTFDASSIGTIIQQSKSVTVANGNLQIQLAPNQGVQTPANVYTVQYQSDGRNQFTETWTVPVSAQPLAVSAVRTGTQTGSGTSGTGATGGQTPIPESSVIGLQADLNQRPTKGAGFGTNGVAIVDDNGVLQTVAGQVGDCVLVDGTSGPCSTPTFVDAEVPAGTVDGANDTFTLANAPTGTSLMLFRNGLYLTTGFDYSLVNATIQFVAGAIPRTGDTLTASYRVDPAAAGSVGVLTNGGSAVRSVSSAQVICSAQGRASAAIVMTTLGACDIPAAQMNPGDRIEVRFTFAHSGMALGFDFQMDWGSTAALARHGDPRDAAVAGSADVVLLENGAQISAQSWGTVLAFQPKILMAPLQHGVRVVLRAAMTPGAAAGASDNIRLTNFTVLRYPAN